MTVNALTQIRGASILIAHTACSTETEEADEPPSLVADEEVLEVVDAVIASLERRGLRASSCAVDSQRPLLHPAPRDKRPLIVFNLVDSTAQDPSLEADFAESLEDHGVRYTGNASAVLRLALRKERARERLLQCDIPLPWATVARGPDFSMPSERPGPWFVKPAWTDGSIGIDENALVHDEESCRARVAWLMRHLEGPCLVERYLPGLELNVALIPMGGELRAATTAVDFQRCPPGTLPIVTYDCKWTPGTRACEARSIDARELIDDETIRRAEGIARRAFAALGCRAYARIDLRLDDEGAPKVIDVNPNPGLHPDAGFAIAARQLGLSFDDLVLALVAEAHSSGDHHDNASHFAARSRRLERDALAHREFSP